MSSQEEQIEQRKVNLEALEALARGLRPSVVLLDWVLPGIMGGALVAALREQQQALLRPYAVHWADDVTALPPGSITGALLR